MMVLVVCIELIIPIVERQLDGQEMFRVHPDLPPLGIIPSRLVGMADQRQTVRRAARHLVIALEGERYLAFPLTPLMFAPEERNGLLQTHLADRMVGILGCQGTRRLQLQAQKSEQPTRVDENFIVVFALDVDDDTPIIRCVLGHIDFEGCLKTQLDGLQR
jgi:hypothetical protein